MVVYDRSKLKMSNAEYKKIYWKILKNIYLKKFNSGLINFLICLTEDKNDMVNKQLNQIAMRIEQVLAKRNIKFISPLSFSRGLEKWSLSDSKTAHTLDRISSATGCIKILWCAIKDNTENREFLLFKW